MTGGVGLGGCRPALRMLAIGCCAKLRLGGGLAVKDKVPTISNSRFVI